MIATQIRELSSSSPSRNKEETTTSTDYQQIFADYLTVETYLQAKLDKIEQLKKELSSLTRQTSTQNKLKSMLFKANKRLQTSLELEAKQADEMHTMGAACARLDDIIDLKQASIVTLENELKRLEDMMMTEQQEPTRSLSKSVSTSSTLSSQSSRSSILQLSSIRSSAGSLACPTYVSGSDNDSDTGISSVNSDDLQIETLV